MHEQLSFDFYEPELCPVCTEPMWDEVEGHLPGIDDEWVEMCRDCRDAFGLD